MLIVGLLFGSYLSVSVASGSLDWEVTPESIQVQIKQRGLDVVHDEIFENHFVSNMVLLAVDSGQPAWLDVASDLIARDNPQTTKMLYMAIGEAIQWSPETVLGRSDLDLSQVCSTSGLYEWRLFSRFLAETAIDRRIESLNKINDLSLGQNRDFCLQALEDALILVRKTLHNHLPVSP